MGEYYVPRQNAEEYIRARSQLEETPVIRAREVNSMAGLENSADSYQVNPARLNGIMLALERANKSAEGIVSLLNDSEGDGTLGSLFLRENVIYSDLPPRNFRSWLVGEDTDGEANDDYCRVLGKIVKDFNAHVTPKTDENFGKYVSFRLCNDIRNIDPGINPDLLKSNPSARIQEFRLENWPGALFTIMQDFVWDKLFSGEMYGETMRRADADLRRKHMKVSNQIVGLYEAGLQRDAEHQKRILAQYVRNHLDEDPSESYESLLGSVTSNLGERKEKLREIHYNKTGPSVFESERDLVRHFAYLRRALTKHEQFVRDVLLK